MCSRGTKIIRCWRYKAPGKSPSFKDPKNRGKSEAAIPKRRIEAEGDLYTGQIERAIGHVL